LLTRRIDHKNVKLFIQIFKKEVVFPVVVVVVVVASRGQCRCAALCEQGGSVVPHFHTSLLNP
jgi:hypothetical protein